MRQYLRTVLPAIVVASLIGFLISSLIYAPLGYTQTTLQSPSMPNGVYIAGVNSSNVAKGLIGVNSSNKVLIDPDSIGTTVNQNLTVTGTSTLTGATTITGAATLNGGITNAVNLTTSTTLATLPKVTFTTGDFTTSGVGTNLEPITGLTYALPATALNIGFHCAGSYLQNVATAAVSFGVTFSAAPTTSNLSGVMGTTNGTAGAFGQTTISSATSSSVVTGTPGAGSTPYMWSMDGFVENPASNANTMTIDVKTATAANTVTVKRDSYCALQF